MADIFKVIIVNRQKSVKIPIGLRLMVRRGCGAALKLEGLKGSYEVNVTFVDNEYLRSLNKQYRGKDEETDVLSFSMGEDGKYDVNMENGAKMLGDVVVSLEMAEKQSKAYSGNFQKEVVSLVVHGILHLIGYDHEKNKIEYARQSERESIIMRSLGFSAGD
jgi:probable rRNA maturation factor